VSGCKSNRGVGLTPHADLTRARVAAGILHRRQGQSLVEGADLCLSLACAHGGGTTFDSSFEFPAAPAYQRASALSCFRFVDNAMHFSLPEIGRLLHALPVQPAQRRLFFSAHVACRRRLAKRWQETSLAKLFTLDDEFALLFQRSLQSYLRGRIQSLGLSPHDAFAAFDTDSNGMLDMPELYAAFEYLEVPQLAPADVLCFARALSDKGAVPQVKYEVWLEIMSQTSSLAGRAAPASSGGDAIEGGVDAGTGVTGAVGAPHPDGDVPITDASRPAVANALGDPHVHFALKPKCAEELLELLRSTTLAERAVEEQLEATQASAVAAAQAIAEEAAKVVDFSFLRKLRDASHSAGANPFISSSTCFYDLAARDSHQPVGVVGRLLRDLNGPAHTPCVVLPPSSHQVYRVPWRRNGGGANLNCYQISLMIKLQEPNYHRNHTLPLISASGFDSWSTITKSGAGLANGPVTLGLVDGRMAISNGMEQVIAKGKQSVVQAGKWTVVSWNVDANAGTVRCFLNGTAATDTISVDWLKRDGPGTLTGRVAINKFDPNHHRAAVGVTLLRSVSIYNKCLDLEQIAAEANELRHFWLDDVIRNVHQVTWKAPLAKLHAAAPFADSDAVLAALPKVKQASEARVEELYLALVKRREDAVPALVHALSDADLALGCLASCARDPTAGQSDEVGDECAIGSLMNIAAFTGQAALLTRLLDAGAALARRNEHG
jgi:hypothetical protein